jgi:hypothetical protein
MTQTGQVHNGVVVLDAGSPPLPEGARVRIATLSEHDLIRVELRDGMPVVVGGSTGTWNLTNEQIGLIQEQEDIDMLRS